MTEEVWNFLTLIDYEIAKIYKSSGCPRCASCLHWNNFHRKPRGLDFIVEAIRYDLSCGKCQKRFLPESVRFIWHKVYVAAVISLSSIWKTFGRNVSRQTLKRWQQYWKDQLAVNSEFMATSRAKLPVNYDYTIESLVFHYKLNKAEFFKLLGEFLRPLSCAPILRYHHLSTEDGP